MGTGRCKACGIEGRGSRDFICEKCGDPERRTLCCVGCGTRSEATDEVVHVVRRFTGLQVPDRNGITIRISSCDDCGRLDESTQTQVFLVRLARQHSLTVH